MAGPGAGHGPQAGGRGAARAARRAAPPPANAEAGPGDGAATGVEADGSAAADHVSQLQRNPDGSITGRNDCWEACLASYLRDAGYEGLPGDDLPLLRQIALVARGAPDGPDNPPTTPPQAEAALLRFGVGYRWTGLYEEALAARDSICLVDGTLLAPPRYPTSRFGEAGTANHFVRWLPNRDGQPDWFMDPLAGADCRYDLTSVRQALYGAYLLFRPAHTLRAACALKVQPNHACLAIALLQPGQAVEPSGQPIKAVPGPRGAEDWLEVRAAGKRGFVPAALVA